MRVIPALVTSLVFLASFSGCLSAESSEDSELVSEDQGFGSFSVVAPIDTGINVYHNHFVMNESYPPWLLEQLGVNIVCDISTNGTWEERYESD